MHVTVVVLASPDVAAFPLHGTGHHVVDQTVFVCQTSLIEISFELSVEHFLKQVFELSVISLQDGVFGAEVHRVVAAQAITHRGTSEVTNALVVVVHAHRYATICAVVRNLKFHRLTAIFRSKRHRHCSRTRHLEVRGLVLIAMCVTSDHNWLGPTGYESGNVATDNRLTENDATKNVTDRPIWRLPHFLQTKFFNASLIRGDRGALDAHAMLQDGISRIDRDLVIGRIATLHT